MIDRTVEDLLRRETPQVIGALVRRYGHFDAAVEAVQEALLAAATQWPRDGIPDNPRAWLITVAARRLTDLLRSEQARRRREKEVMAAEPSAASVDDSLILLFLCCHPSLPPAAQIALTLRAVGGLTTAEIARAFLVPESTMTRRISRAKQRIKESGVPFRMPTDRAERLDAVLHVLYLIFNEGYLSTAGPGLQRTELATEAIRLARMVHEQLPDDSESTGLLALMLLTDARRAARSSADGAPIPMAQQDRSRWNADYIREGIALVGQALPRGKTGPFQLQAAIAAIHDEAPTAANTDWPQIVALYEVLLGLADNPVVALNHAVAVAMVRGPSAGLGLVAALDQDARIAGDYRLHSVRAHLLEELGDRDGARASFLTAADRAMSRQQERYLRERAQLLSEG